MLIMLRVAIALAASALILFGVSAYEHTLADECDWSGRLVLFYRSGFFVFVIISLILLRSASP